MALSTLANFSRLNMGDLYKIVDSEEVFIPEYFEELYKIPLLKQWVDDFKTE